MGIGIRFFLRLFFLFFIAFFSFQHGCFIIVVLVGIGVIVMMRLILVEFIFVLYHRGRCCSFILFGSFPCSFYTLRERAFRIVEQDFGQLHEEGPAGFEIIYIHEFLVRIIDHGSELAFAHELLDRKVSALSAFNLILIQRAQPDFISFSPVIATDEKGSVMLVIEAYGLNDALVKILKVLS